MPLPHEIKEGQRFDIIATDYDRDTTRYPIRTQVREEVISIVKQRKPQSVLDMGCGSGHALIQLSPHIKHGTGIDVSNEMVTVARQNAQMSGCSNIKFEYGSFLDLANDKLNWFDNKFHDIVMTIYSMHHLKLVDKRKALSKIALFLPINGIFIMGDIMFFENPCDHPQDFQQVGFDPCTDYPETIETLIMMMEELNFTVTQTSIHPLAGIIVGKKLGSG